MGLLALTLVLGLAPTATAQTADDPFADEATVGADTGTDPFATYEQQHTATNKTTTTDAKVTTATDTPKSDGTTDNSPTTAAPSAASPDKKTPGAGAVLSTLAIVGAALLAANWRRR